MSAKTITYALIILALMLFLPGIATLPILDRDSARFSQASKQMVEDHQYWKIHFQDELRHKKPPGYYWLQTLSLKATAQGASTDPWPYRIPSVLGALLSVCGLYLLSRPMIGDKIAATSAALLGCSALLCFEAHITTTDACQLASIVIMQCCLWRLYVDKDAHPLICIGFWLALSAGALIKGIAPLIALLTLIPLLFLNVDRQWINRLKPLYGLSFFILITAIWIIGFSVEEHSNFILNMIGNDLAPKVLHGQEHHGYLPGYHAALLLLTFWPGSLLLWYGIAYCQQYLKQPNTIFLLAWLLPSWIVFEIIPTKLPQYILPMLPAVSLLVSLGFWQFKSLPKASFQWLNRINILIWTLTTLGLSFVFWWGDYNLRLSLGFDAHLGLQVLLVIMTLLIVSVFYFIFAEKKTHLLVTLIVCSTLIYALAFKVIIPNWNQVWLTENILTTLKKHPEIQLTNNDPLYVYEYREPSLVFRLGTHLVHYLYDGLAPRQPIHWLLLPESKLPGLRNPTTQSRAKVHVIASVDGFLYPKGHWEHYLLVEIL